MSQQVNNKNEINKHTSYLFRAIVINTLFPILLFAFVYYLPQLNYFYYTESIIWKHLWNDSLIIYVRHIALPINAILYIWLIFYSRKHGLTITPNRHRIIVLMLLINLAYYLTLVITTIYVFVYTFT